MSKGSANRVKSKSIYDQNYDSIDWGWKNKCPKCGSEDILLIRQQVSGDCIEILHTCHDCEHDILLDFEKV